MLKKFTVLLSTLLCCLIITAPSVAAQPNLKGDTNNDGIINISDCTHIQKYLVNIISDINITNSDFNGDGIINISDCTYIQKYLTGNIFLYNGFIYTKETNDTASIIKYNGASTNIKIPSIVDNCTITKIGDYAFSNNKTIKTVAVPSTVFSIGFYAFNNCTALEKLSIKNSNCHIDSSTFEGCTSLQYLVFG